MKTKRNKGKIRADRKSISVPCSEPAQELRILRPDAAGIDCGAQEHYVAVPPDRVSAGQPTVRRFSAFTEGLDAVVDWLKDCRVTTVAMVCVRSLFTETGDTIITEEVRKFPSGK